MFLYDRDEYKKLDQGDVLFIVQCDSGHINGDLIACAKYRLEDVIHEESKIYQFQQLDTASPGLEETTAVSQSHQLERKARGHFFALFTVYLPRKHGHTKSSFVSFLGGDWRCTHIDDFFPVHSFFSAVSALADGKEQMTLSQLFRMIYIDPPSPDTPGATATGRREQLEQPAQQQENDHQLEQEQEQEQQQEQEEEEEEQQQQQEQQQELQQEQEQQQEQQEQQQQDQLGQEQHQYECKSLYVHIQQAVEKAGHLPTGITAGRMKRLNKTLLKLLRNKINRGMSFLCIRIHLIIKHFCRVL